MYRRIPCYPHRFALLPVLLVAACAVHPARAAGPGALAPEQQEFWRRVEELCGQAFPGRVIEAPPTDTVFPGRELIMHVRECEPDEIRIPLHVGEDRSRTWVLTRTEPGLRLKHDHRHRDGTPDANTDYGGDTHTAGSIWRQEFPADAFSISAVPARATQLWFLEIRPGQDFTYGLRREATGLRYRFEFDLTSPVPPPPPPWGW